MKLFTKNNLRFFVHLRFFVSIILLFSIFSVTYAETGVPSILSYQGRLTDSSGNLLGGAGTPYFFKFSFWDAPTVASGTQVWPLTSPSAVSLTVKQGVFNVNIGDIENSYPDILNYNFGSNKKIYLQVEASANNSSFETLSPRQRITSAPFAEVAGSLTPDYVQTLLNSIIETDPIWNTASTSLSVTNFATSSISQWLNDSGYLTAFTESDPLFMAASSSLPYQSPGSYLTSFTELDPIWSASSWSTTTNNSTDWNTAFSWGNHTGLYDLLGTATTTASSTLANWLASNPTSGTNTGDNATNTQYSGLAGSKQDALNGTGFVKASGTSITYDNNTYLTAETDPLFTAWDKHAGISITESQISDLQSYLTAESDTLASITARGASTSVEATFSGGLVTSKIRPVTDSTTAVGIFKADGVTNVLNVDTTNGRVGIGTTSPTAKLDITGTAGSADIFAISSSTNTRLFTVAASGKVGIGTIAPTNMLEVGSVTNGGNVAINGTESAELLGPLSAVGWSLGTGWADNGNGTLTHTGAAAGAITALAPLASVVAGRVYKTVITMTNAKTTYMELGGYYSYNFTGSTGTFTFYTIATNTAAPIITASGANSVTITSISIKEVTNGDLLVYGKARFANAIYNAFGNKVIDINSAGKIGLAGADASNSGYSLNVSGSILASGTNVGMYASFFGAHPNFLRYGTTGIIDHDPGPGNTANLRINTLYGATNYERLSITGVVGNGLNLSAESGGTGAANLNITLSPKGTGYTILNGKVGIGTAAPAGLLHVSSDTAATGQTFLTQANASADSFDLNFRKARGTGASPTVITTADELGVINFTGYGGAAGYITGAAIKGISSGTIADSRVPGQLSFWTGTNAAPSVLTERMTITNAGNVGIGTASPTTTNGGLDISSGGLSLVMGADGSLATRTNATDKFARYGIYHYTNAEEPTAALWGWNTSTSNNLYFGGGTGALNAATALIFFTAANNTTLTGTERMRIKSDGNVGIGTTSPGEKLDVWGNLQVGTSSTPILYVDTANNYIGIGTTTATALLTINDPTADTDAIRILGGAGSNIVSIGQGSNKTGTLSLKSSASTKTFLTANGSSYFTGGSLGLGTSDPTTNFQVAQVTAGVGTVSVGLGGTVWTGVGTKFLNTFKVGDTITSSGQTLTIQSVNSDTSLTTNAVGAAISAKAYTLSGGTRFSVLGNGNVGIGTTTPSQVLSVVGNAQFTAVGSGSYSTDLNLTADGTLTTSASDIALKMNLEALNATTSTSSISILDKVIGLKPYHFNWKTDPTGTKDIGLIAQDVEGIFPEITFTNKTDGYKGINYSRLSVILVSAIQELNDKVVQFGSYVVDGVANFASVIATKFTGDEADIKNIKTEKVCLGETCIDEAMLKEIILKNSITDTTSLIIEPVVPPTSTSTASTTESVASSTDPVATSTEPIATSTEPVIEEPVATTTEEVIPEATSTEPII